MKKFILIFFAFFAFNFQINAQSILNITTSGGSFPTEKWVSISTEIDGGGTQVWGQGDGTYGNGSGLINEDIDLPPGTYFVNCYDSYSDGWDGTLISVTSYGVLLGNNGGTSPSDTSTNDNTGSWETPEVELEASFQIVVTSPPSCLPPADLVMTNSTSNSADFSWAEDPTVTTWNIEYGIEGFTQGTGTTDTATTAAYSLTGVDSNTNYDFYIQSNCGDSTSNWVGPLDFTTSPGCGDTLFDSGGATGDYASNDLITVTVYADNPGDLVTFTFISFGTESCCDDLTVYDGPDTTADVVGVYAGSTVPDPITSSHPTGALTFVFDSDFSVNDIGYEILVSCAPAPSCLQVSDLEVSAVTGNSVDISWTANNGETAWEYVIQPQGTGEPTTAGIPITTNPYTITGLDSSTDYEVFVRAICDGADESPWRGPVNFSTSPVCGDTIFDSGGATGNYANNDLITVTIFPDTEGDLVTFTFISFDIESGWDFLTVYDGPDVSSTEVGNFTGSTIPDPISSSHPTGALTFVFDSDGSVNDPGYEILVTCAPAPSCLQVSDLEVSTVTGNSVDISWTANNGETAWEYVIQPQGTGEPTTAGVPITTNPYTITGLDSSTDYEVFVRAICDGADESPWRGPVNFSTSPVCGDTIFDSGGATGNYANNDLITVTIFPENPGDLVTFTFISFDTENNYDFLTVYDGPDVSSTEVGSFSGTTVPDPISSTHSTGALTFVFDSDGSVNDPGYEILVTCAPPPSCYPPTALTISNISGTTADFNWTAGTGNSMWEYVIVPTGDPAPTGNGTSTDVTSTQFTELDFETTYDVYVRADCGTEDGYSTWSGPVTFTTTQQTNYTVDCASGAPVNINYCYGNNDTMFWVFTSTTGFPLSITFNTGRIEGFSDDITVYDGLDNTGTVLFNNNTNNTNDLAGLVIESTSSSIYIEVDSDGSVSCQSTSSYTAWDFDVSCKTCITQTVDFNILGDCEVSQDFYIDVNVSDLGSATSVVVSDNLASPEQTVTSTGVITFGPYTAGVNVIIETVNGDDDSCVANSGALTFLCPPPPNECSVIYAGEDTTFCGGTSTNLTATYHILGQDTTSYEVTSQEGCPMPQLTGGTPTSLDIDDTWSDIIDLGFEFCFFGETYSQILIGSNGVLSFELENAGGGNGYSLDSDDTLPNSSNSTLSEANIFGVGHDIDPSVCGDINYVILGASPSRQFVVNYSEVCHFGSSCNDLKSSSQIILYESSNTIDVNIHNKPTCSSWNDGNAVVGVQNVPGTVAFTPPGRNTSIWDATDEFWRFTPSLGDPDFTVEWFDGTTSVGTGDTVTVSPTETTVYTAAITYNLCTGGTATLTDDVEVGINPTPDPVPTQSTVYSCSDQDSVLEVTVTNSDVPDTLTYYWSYDGNDVQSGPDNTYTVPAGSDQVGEYFVTVIDERNCYGDTTITLVAGVTPELEDDTVFTKCTNEDIELSVNVLNADLLGSDLEYVWSIDGAEVQTGSDYTYTHVAGQALGFVEVTVIDLMTTCQISTQIEVASFMNAECVDIPQGLSPNGDGMNDCLVLDHLEASDDIVKAEIYNRYGVKVFELNDYTSEWCGQDASSGNSNSNDLLPVGTYFYVIQFNSGRAPITSWIYLNY